MTNYIFIIGGVISGLGKGVISASIAAVLKDLKFKVTVKKLDPYLNIDPGTMNPREHGEVFVTNDGAETDLDLGYYERFTGLNLTKDNSTSSGKLLYELLNNERKGVFLGSTIQMIPHFTNSIKNFIQKNDKYYDFIICEIGGSVGDYESTYFLESIRQMKLEGYNVMVCIVTYILYYSITKELKTKPTQNAVKQLMSSGLQPDLLFARTEHTLSEPIKKKISLFTNVPINNIIESINVNSIYKVPLNHYKENLMGSICSHFNIKYEKPSFNKWIELNSKINNLKNTINVGIIGKYVELEDSYYSLIEAVKHAGFHLNSKINFIWINARKDVNFEPLEEIDCIIIPGGFGNTGIQNIIKYINYCRTHNIPTLGICLGFQLAVIEFCRNVLNIENATSSEFDVIGTFVINKKTNDEIFGGTMRLGSYPIDILPDTFTYQIYEKNQINERHRHRYELDVNYIKLLKENGMIISGIYKNEKGLIPEILEIPDLVFFICCQYHPEFNSTPFEPNPLFVKLLKSML